MFSVAFKPRAVFLFLRFACLFAACISVSPVIYGCGRSNAAAKDDASLRREFKKPRSISDVPPDKRAMVEAILRSQREGKAPVAPSAARK